MVFAVTQHVICKVSQVVQWSKNTIFATILTMFAESRSHN